jgi:hypothetical protein
VLPGFRRQPRAEPDPAAGKPAIDVYANNDSFTGRPIETMGMERQVLVCSPAPAAPSLFIPSRQSYDESMDAMPNLHPDAEQMIDDAVRAALMHKRLEQLEQEMASLKADREKFLRWGVIVLGGAVVSLVTYLFNLLTKHA